MTRRIDAHLNFGPHLCSVCGQGYETPELAAACAAQPKKENPIPMGGLVQFPFIFRGMVFEVVEHHVAAMSHEPMALAKSATNETQGITAEMFEEYRVR